VAIFDQHLLQQAAAEEQRRLLRIQRAWQAYYGQHPRAFKVRPGQADDNVVVNKAQIICDKSVSFLFGQEVTWSLDADAGISDAQEQWLEAVWATNRKLALLQDLALTGAVTGHAFVKIRLEAPYPRLIDLDPATVFPTWDPHDVSQVLVYRIQYSGLDPKTGKPRSYRQLIARDGDHWVITDQESEPDQTIWVTVNEEIWPYPFAPIVDCQNLPAPQCFWGRSDIEDDLLSVNKARNFILSNWVKIQRYHGHPRSWGRGFRAAQLETAADGTIVFPDKDAELRNLEMQSDQEGASTLDRRLDEAIHEMGCTPAVATGKLESLGDLSGTALQVLYGPLVEKTIKKRGRYGPLLVELNRRLLAIQFQRDDLVVSLNWPELLPTDPQEDANVALLDQQMGIASKATLAAKRGYDWDQEQQKIQAEDSAMGDRMLTAFDRGQSGPDGAGPSADGRRR